MAGETLTQGTKLLRGDGGNPEIFTAVPGITGITGLRSGQAAEIDNTDLDSVAVERLPGLPDEGTVTANVKRILGNPQQEGLLADRKNQVIRNFRILYRTGQYEAFSGYVLSFPTDAASPNEILRGALQIRVTGEVGQLQGP